VEGGRRERGRSAIHVTMKRDGGQLQGPKCDEARKNGGEREGMASSRDCSVIAKLKSHMGGNETSGPTGVCLV